MKDFHPAISIVIPVYNGANYLAEAIDSALAQTYPACEIIVVDDGSSDDGATRRVAARYGDRIRYLYRENGGCGAALNTGIRAMTGEYFSWLSHDDLYLPDKLEQQVRVLAGLEDKETLLYGNYEVMDAGGKTVHVMRMQDLGSAEQLSVPLFPLTHGIIHGCALLVARSLFARHGVFDERLKTTQDYDLWFRMLRHTPVHFIERALVRSRVHDEQGSRTLPEMQAEGDRLWERFVEEVTPEEAVRMYGSHFRYLRHLESFLAMTPYAKVVPLAGQRAREALSKTLVSVVIPFRDRIDWTCQALASALTQSHASLDVLLVDDGSSEDAAPLHALAGGDPRVRYVRQDAAGAAAARNRGVALARGDYVAFLDSDDLWLPDKVARQLAQLLEERRAVGHTDYQRIDACGGDQDTVTTHHLCGRVYPDLIGSCQIATPTVMARTDLLRQHPFPTGVAVGEDVITWINLTEHHEVAALSAPLSKVRLSEHTTTLSLDKSERGLANILAAVLEHPRHRQHHAPILRLIEALQRHELARQRDVSARAGAAHADAGGRAISAREQWRHRLILARGLLRMGWHSLRREGPGVTWQRVRRWLRR